MAVDFSGFERVLKSLGVTGQVRELPEPAPTAATAAAQLGCEVGAIANSLVFAADGAPLLVMTSGAHRVDTSRVAELIGASVVSRADPQSVRDWTGQPIGGVAPVAHSAPIRTLVDTWLSRYDVVWAAAGHPHTVFPASFGELLRITSGTAADVGSLRRLVPKQRVAPEQVPPVPHARQQSPCGGARLRPQRVLEEITLDERRISRTAMVALAREPDYAGVLIDPRHVLAARREFAGEHAVTATDFDRGTAAVWDSFQDHALVVDVVVPVAD